MTLLAFANNPNARAQRPLFSAGRWDAITGSKIVCLGSGPGLPYQLASGSVGNWTLSQPDGSTQGFSGCVS